MCAAPICSTPIKTWRCGVQRLARVAMGGSKLKPNRLGPALLLA